jgi:hypothetical protein
MIKFRLDVLVDAVFRGLLMLLFLAIFFLTVDTDAAAQATGATADTATLTNWIIGGGLALLSLLVSVVGFFLTRTLKAIEAGQDKIVDKIDKIDDRVKHVELTHEKVKSDVGHLLGRVDRMEGQA